MDFGRLLTDEPLRPRWSTANALVYIGGFVVLAAVGTLLGILADLHGEAALIGYSAVATAAALGLAFLLQVRERAVAAGFAATLAVLFFAVCVGAFLSLIGLLDAESEGYTPAIHPLEAATLAAAVLALYRFRAPLLVLVITLTVFITLVDIAATVPWRHAGTVAALVVGAAIAAAGVVIDRFGREPYGFWPHVVGGVAVGGAILDLVSGDLGWALVAVISLVYVAAAYVLGRSSYAVLGAIGILATTAYFAVDVVSFVGGFVPFGPGPSEDDVEPWQVAAWFVAAGLVIGLLGVVGERLRAPWSDRDDPRRDRDELAPDA